MKKYFAFLLVILSTNTFAVCMGGFSDPNYQACIRQEEAIQVQKDMLEMQRKQMEQQRADQAVRDSEMRYRNW